MSTAPDWAHQGRYDNSLSCWEKEGKVRRITSRTHNTNPCQPRLGGSAALFRILQFSLLYMSGLHRSTAHVWHPGVAWNIV
jgi:hypothetical protein